MSAAAASADIRCVTTPINPPSGSPEPNFRDIAEKIGTPVRWDTRICDYKEPSLPAQPDKEPSLPAPTPAPEPTPAPAVDHNDPQGFGNSARQYFSSPAIQQFRNSGI